jgi:hypothetical protein
MKFVRIRRRGAVAFSLAILLQSVGGGSVSAANYPNFTYSIYVKTMSGTAANTAGCDLGKKATTGTRPSDALVILDFGYPINQNNTWGTLLLTSTFPFESTTAIAGVVENFATGFWNCTTSAPRLRIAIGENTANVSVNGVAKNYFNAANGTAWAGLVNNVNAWLATSPHIYSSQISAAGAADIENAAGWASYSNAKAWADAFSAATSYAYYNFGDANGCSYANTFANNTCSASWNTAGKFYVSWGAARAFAAPEDYNMVYSCAAQGCTFGNVDHNSRQWEAIVRYAVHAGRLMSISAVVTQHEACAQTGDCGTAPSGTNNSPAVGDGDMYNALNHDYAPSETGQTLQWTTDFEWGYTLS